VEHPLGPWIDRLVRDHRPLPPLAQLVAVVGDYGWAPAIALGVTLPALLLPDGRLRSHRWRVVVATSVAGATLAVVAGSLAPGRLESMPIDNPFGLPGTAGTIALVLTLPGWAGILPNATTFVIYPAMLCPPVAIAVAVLRYRLWDLDRLVSRTVTYALLTALLVLPYLLVLPAASRLAGGAGSLAVAAATLAAVAAFAPLRRRVQGLVDRRFNRRRYDAERTVAGFAARLRGQVDLDALAAELLAVVDQTVQPTQASLWLRPQPSPRPQR
jgi:hypothetical protein